MDLKSLYALGLQALTVLVLIYVVAMLGARSMQRHAPEQRAGRLKASAYRNRSYPGEDVDGPLVGR